MENEGNEQLLQWIRNHFFGKYRGLVTDNDDSTNRGRVKVSVPSVLNDLEVWAMPCLPFAGEDVGLYTIPEPGAGVWVEFEGGDSSYPIWTGGFWADNELPKDEKGSDTKPSLRIFKSEKGLMIHFNDDSETLTLSDSQGDNILTLEVQDGKIKIQAKLKVVVEAPQIELVENSTHPLVYGDDLLQYLNQIVQTYAAHTHPGQMAGPVPVSPAPPMPIMTPPTPALLSQKVKTG
ncbi:MAG TPA: phage baseplate assembly protein V [Puia sp.]|nr:phage baseplate assembly protein V [Puia sp.]